MATLTIRNLDDPLKRLLRLRAASQNRSMEEEVRQILRGALMPPAEPAAPMDLAHRVRARFADLGDVEIAVAPREPVSTPPDFAAYGSGESR